MPDDYTATTQTTGMVTVGGSTRGRIETWGDRDWFAVTLDAGRTYRIDLEGTWTGDGTLKVPALYDIRDADGVRIAGTKDNYAVWGRNSRVYFTAEEDATYYVNAGGYRGYVGTYKLSVEEVTDDYAAKTWTSGAVAVGGSVTGELDYGRDRDWFAVTLEAGKSYRIDLEGSISEGGTLTNPSLYGVHNANGARLPGAKDNDGGWGRNSRVYFTAEEDATYYVAAGAYGNKRGTYTLSVVEGADDYTAGRGTTGVVAVGGTTTGEIEAAGDRDWFAVTLEAGKIYQVDLEGSGTGALSDPYLRGVHDADGARLPGTRDNDGGTGGNSRVTFTAEGKSTYYVNVGAYRDAVGDYTLSVAEVTDDRPDDYTAGIGTSGAVAVGGSVTGEIEYSGDRDWFAVEFDAGKTYRIELDKSGTGAGALYDPYLRGIYDASGVRFADTTNDDGGDGRNSRVYFTAEDTGAYYVAAGADGTKEGTYVLSVTEIPGEPGDFTAGTGTSGAVAVGGSARGEIDFRYDRDWFAVALDAGRTYRIDLEGRSTKAGTLYDPYLYGIHDANGILITGTENDGGGTYRNSRVLFTAEENATYYVNVGADGNERGSYVLSVTDVDDFVAGTWTSGTVAVGGSATGKIDFNGDRDWFAVTLDTGGTYRIDLEGSSTRAGNLRDPYLRGIHDADGDLITRTTNDDGGAGGNSRVTFTVQDAGTYYVAAGGRGAGRGAYKLSVTEVRSGVEDDFAAGTGTNGAVAVGGTTTGEIEFGGDRDWFAVTLVAGKTYRIDLEGSETGEGTLYDPYLRGIYGASGARYAGTTDDDGGEGRNSRVYFTAPYAGTYYVAAGADGTGEGTYKLSVTEGTDDIADDFADGIGTSGAVEVGGSVTGEIDYGGDRDWFAVEFDAGKSYRIDLANSQRYGQLKDPHLRGIHDENGNLIAGTENDNSGGLIDSRVMFTAVDTGTYYVAAGFNGNDVGSYTLSVEEVM